MGWDNAGGYNRQHNFSADASAGIKILALRMDQELDDIASAIPIALAKNGQNVPTANLPMGGFRHINVGAPTSVGNYMRSREFIENIPVFMDDTASSADRISVSAQYFTSVSANQAPGDGTRILVRVLSNKSSAALYLNGHSANIELQDGNRAAAAMVSGGIYEMLFSSVDAAWKITRPDDGRTATERSAGVTPTNYQYPPLNVLRYGAVGDGATDDSAAIQRAVDVAAVGGGSVIFPDDKNYKWALGSQVTVSSPYPVNLLGNMTCNPNQTGESSYIKPLNNIAGALIQYTSPTATLADGGGGIVRGLAFMDDSGDLDNADLTLRRGSYTLDAALDLEAFSLSTIENCSFHCILGSGVKVGLAVMSNFDNLWIRYCGNTSKPAFNHPSDASYAMQSCRLSSIRAEVNFDEPYIYVAGNTNCKDNTWLGLGFEASPTGAATGYGIEYFVDYAADFSSFVGCHFNRNGATYAMRISGDNNTVADTAGDDASWGGFVEVTGNNNNIRGGTVAASQSTISTILLGGENNTVDGLTLYYANRIYNTGTNNKLIGVNLFDCTSLGTYLIESTGRLWVTGANVRNNNSNRAVSPSGISVAAEARICGCTFIGNSAATGINVATASQIVTDNFLDGYTNEIVPNGHMADSIIERNIGFVTEYQAQAQIAAGSTSVTAAHGLAFTPSLQMVRCAPLGDWGNSTNWWVSSVDATNVVIQVDVAPGGSGLYFGISIAPR